MIRGKRGQELSTNTIIIIILAIIVLVVVALGFAIGFDKLNPFIKGNNVKDVQSACGVACATQSTFDYCSVARELKNGTASFMDSCSNFSSKTEYAVYDIKTCTTITCPLN
ncbi:MAG: hypothetical protein WD876_01880 [Candidatus Pacearchaeota archaeon]